MAIDSVSIYKTFPELYEEFAFGPDAELDVVVDKIRDNILKNLFGWYEQNNLGSVVYWDGQDDKGQRSFKFNFCNFKGSLNLRGLRLLGSVSRYINKTIGNIGECGSRELEKTINDMGLALGMSFFNSHISRIDINTDLITPLQYDIKTILDAMGDIKMNNGRTLKRCREYPTTLYYLKGGTNKKGASEIIRIYDKKTQMQMGGEDVPECWKSVNVLRFEVSLKGSDEIRRVLNAQTATIGDVLNNYPCLNDELLQMYDRVQKRDIKSHYDISKATSRKDADIIMVVAYMDYSGGGDPQKGLEYVMNSVCNWDRPSRSKARSKWKKDIDKVGLMKHDGNDVWNIMGRQVQPLKLKNQVKKI